MNLAAGKTAHAYESQFQNQFLHKLTISRKLGTVPFAGFRQSTVLSTNSMKRTDREQHNLSLCDSNISCIYEFWNWHTSFPQQFLTKNRSFRKTWKRVHKYASIAIWESCICRIANLTCSPLRDRLRCITCANDAFYSFIYNCRSGLSVARCWTAAPKVIGACWCLLSILQHWS